MPAVTRFLPRDRMLLGIGMTVAAYALFSCQDALIKLLVAGLSVWQVMFFRSITIVACCIGAGGPGVLRQALRSRVLPAMLLRSAIILGAWLCFYTAARSMQLAELTTVYFVAPVIVMLFAVPLLGERIPLPRWIAVLTGFAGVYVACDPRGIGLSLPVVLVLAAAALWALGIVLLRKTALDERTLIQLLLNNGFFLAAACVPLAFLWQTPPPADLVLLVATGLVGGMGQYMLFEGMKRAPASLIAPFEYTSLIWAFLLGFLIWGDVPRREVFAGAAMIAAAGLIIVVSEGVSHRRRAARQAQASVSVGGETASSAVRRRL